MAWDRTCPLPFGHLAALRHLSFSMQNTGLSRNEMRGVRFRSYRSDGHGISLLHHTPTPAKHTSYRQELEDEGGVPFGTHSRRAV